MSIKQLWAPWRMTFLKEEPPKAGECIFCNLLKKSESHDRESLILYRTKKVFVILNKYPYNNGHLMVVPLQHTADFSTLDSETRLAVMNFTDHCIQALRQAYKPEGFNLGMNLGAAGGAGIREHLHMHIVPRWLGDTNFMPVVADTKAMPQHLEASFDSLKSYFQEVR